MIEYFEHALVASRFLRDLIIHWYVWWPVGIVIFVLAVRCYRDEFNDREAGAMAGGLIGLILGFIWPIVAITAPFWLPLLLVMVGAIAAAFAINKIWSR